MAPSSWASMAYEASRSPADRVRSVKAVELPTNFQLPCQSLLLVEGAFQRGVDGARGSGRLHAGEQADDHRARVDLGDVAAGQAQVDAPLALSADDDRLFTQGGDTGYWRRPDRFARDFRWCRKLVQQMTQLPPVDLLWEGLPLVVRAQAGFHVPDPHPVVITQQ